METILSQQTGWLNGLVLRELFSEELQRRLLRAAILVRLFHHKFNRWPKSLDELTQLDTSVDLDSLQPIGDKPLGYRTEPDGTVLLWAGNPRDSYTHVATLETPEDPPWDDMAATNPTIWPVSAKHHGNNQ